MSSQQRLETQLAQARAADPVASAWVAANAGTGKTYVLVTRVLRLLLAGTPPGRILCLTYTKAAAAEMSNRLFARLANWATADLPTLHADLAVVTGTAAEDGRIADARSLFARAIETPGGLKVQTIHAFCERLLRRFPLEAGVASGFTVLDEATEVQLRRAAIDAVLTQATGPEAGALGPALNLISTRAINDSFDNTLKSVLDERDWLRALVTQDDAGDGDPHAAIMRGLHQSLGVRPGADDTTLADALSDCIDRPLARTICALLSDGLATDLKLLDTLSEAVQPDAALEARIAAITGFLLTQAGEPRKKLFTKKLAEQRPDLDARLKRTQAEVMALLQERQALAVATASSALIRIADAVLQRFEAGKAQRAALTFDDLIAATARLLSTSPDAQWVLFKLDGGLDHILVDEAQDTAPAQWQVVKGLAAEFFTGAGATETVRTLFAVGDEKQSIYGFQGAEPRLFAEFGEYFAGLAQAIQHPFHRVPLTLSFRSTAAVLGGVDAVFASAEAQRGLTADTASIRHAADRLGQAGLVEIWPLAMPVEIEEVEPFLPGLEAAEPTAMSPMRQVAARVADRIAAMLSSGERLQSEDRPIRAGDVLVLLRKRRPLGPEIIRALEQRGVAVAGADRVRVTEEIGVEDLMALGQVLLLPEDDLALAAVLKCPLFDLSEDALFTLAYDRKGSLWSGLLKAADTDRATFGAAATQLKRWRSEADFLPPYEFYAAVLDRDGGRRKLLGRLGPEAADTLDEFLNMALQHDAVEPPSLQGFLAWLARTKAEIKRDMDQGRNEVRVMTVHAAKGLEAPIVFLPDTCSRPASVRATILGLPPTSHRPDAAQAMVWMVKGAGKVAAIEAASEAAGAAADDEHRRLLYVAMTRPRDRLYVAGYANAKGLKAKGCWYELIEAGLGGLLADAEAPSGLPVRQLTSPQTASPEPPRHGLAVVAATVPYPDWALRPAARETDRVVPLAPSRLVPLESDEGTGVMLPVGPVTRSPIGDLDRRRFLRGTLTHALLQHLPGLPAAQRQTAALRYLTAEAPDMTLVQHRDILGEVLAILDDPSFGLLFASGSRAEVPVAALLPLQTGVPVRVSGQIDRLVVTDAAVLILDYKANRLVPESPEDVPRSYLLQLAAYRLVLARIYPRRTIRAALLWTAVPRLMELPAGMLDTAASDILNGRDWT